MKRLLILLFITGPLLGLSQINDTVTLRTRINYDIIPNNNGSITATKLNNILNGNLNILPALLNKKVDSIWANGLTLYIKKGANTYTYAISNDPAAVKYADSLAKYVTQKALRDTITAHDGLHSTSDTTSLSNRINQLKKSYYTINSGPDSSYFTVASIDGTQVDTIKFVSTPASSSGGSGGGTINSDYKQILIHMSYTNGDGAIALTVLKNDFPGVTYSMALSGNDFILTPSDISIMTNSSKVEVQTVNIFDGSMVFWLIPQYSYSPGMPPFMPASATLTYKTVNSSGSVTPNSISHAFIDIKYYN